MRGGAPWSMFPIGGELQISGFGFCSYSHLLSRTQATSHHYTNIVSVQSLVYFNFYITTVFSPLSSTVLHQKLCMLTDFNPTHMRSNLSILLYRVFFFSFSLSWLVLFFFFEGKNVLLILEIVTKTDRTNRTASFF